MSVGSVRQQTQCRSAAPRSGKPAVLWPFCIDTTRGCLPPHSIVLFAFWFLLMRGLVRTSSLVDFCAWMIAVNSHLPGEWA